MAQGMVVEGASMRYLPLVAGLLACGQQPGSHAPAKGTETASLAAQAPTVVSVDTVTLQVPLRLPSQLYVEHDAAVFARSSGVVQSILADLGSRVRAGQLLAQLETTDQEIALSQAREKFTSAQQTVERQRALKVAGVVTQADSERIESEYREAVPGSAEGRTRSRSDSHHRTICRDGHRSLGAHPPDGQFRRLAVSDYGNESVTRSYSGTRGFGRGDPHRNLG